MRLEVILRMMGLGGAVVKKSEGGAPGLVVVELSASLALALKADGSATPDPIERVGDRVRRRLRRKTDVRIGIIVFATKPGPLLARIRLDAIGLARDLTPELVSAPAALVAEAPGGARVLRRLFANAIERYLLDHLPVVAAYERALGTGRGGKGAPVAVRSALRPSIELAAALGSARAIGRRLAGVKVELPSVAALEALLAPLVEGAGDSAPLNASGLDALVDRLVAGLPTRSRWWRILASSECDAYRASAAESIRCPADVLTALALEDTSVSSSALTNPSCPPTTIMLVQDDVWIHSYEALSLGPNTPTAALSRLAHSRATQLRRAAALCPSCPRADLAKLVFDSDIGVRAAAAESLRDLLVDGHVRLRNFVRTTFGFASSRLTSIVAAEVAGSRPVAWMVPIGALLRIACSGAPADLVAAIDVFRRLPARRRDAARLTEMLAWNLDLVGSLFAELDRVVLERVVASLTACDVLTWRQAVRAATAATGSVLAVLRATPAASITGATDLIEIIAAAAKRQSGYEAIAATRLGLVESWPFLGDLGGAALDSRLKVEVPETAADLKRYGETLGNCLATDFANYVLKALQRQGTVVALVDDTGRPRFVAELDLQAGRPRIVQVEGRNRRKAERTIVARLERPLGLHAVSWSPSNTCAAPPATPTRGQSR